MDLGKPLAWCVVVRKRLTVLLVTESCLTLATPWTGAHQPPLSMEFSRQDYRSGLLFPSAGNLPDPGIKLRSLALQADSLPSEPPGKQKDRDCIMGLTNKKIHYEMLLSFPA